MNRQKKIKKKKKESKVSKEARSLWRLQHKASRNQDVRKVIVKDQIYGYNDYNNNAAEVCIENDKACLKSKNFVAE